MTTCRQMLRVDMKIDQPQVADLKSEQVNTVSTNYTVQVPLVTLLQDLIVCQGQVSNCTCCNSSASKINAVTALALVLHKLCCLQSSQCASRTIRRLIRTCSAALNWCFVQTKIMSACHVQEPHMAFAQASQMKLMLKAMACCNGLLSGIGAQKTSMP